MYGEQVAGYPVGMVNEREIRASAGILFFVGIVVYMIALTTVILSMDNSDILANFTPAKYMIIAFLFDFSIRIIAPKYAPSLVLGRMIVSNQVPEYVGAKQKRFAWIIGVILAVIMLWTMVIEDIRGPINFIVCGLCLGLLFLESAFGICLGCKVYTLFDKTEQQYCAGGVCETTEKRDIQRISVWQLLSIVMLVVLMFATPYLLSSLESNIDKDCTVPQFAIDMGHEEIWKQHNNCL